MDTLLVSTPHLNAQPSTDLELAGVRHQHRAMAGQKPWVEHGAALVAVRCHVKR